MTVKPATSRSTPKIVYLCCFCVVILLLVWSAFYIPAVPDNLKTQVIIENICTALKYATVHAGHSNVLEYVNSLSDGQDIPRMVSSPTINQIISDMFKASESYKDGALFDEWGQPIVVALTTNHAEKGCVIIHSFGKNKKNENGDGDDIMMWFTADDVSLGTESKINQGQPPQKPQFSPYSTIIYKSMREKNDDF